MHLLLVLLALVGLLPARAADTWTQSGKRWQSSAGMAFELPEGISVTPSPDGSLTLTGNNVKLSLQTAASKEQAEQFYAALQAKLKPAGATWQPAVSSKHGGFDRTDYNGTASLQGKTVNTVAGYLADGKHTVFYFGYYPAISQPTYQELMTSISDTLSFK